MRRIVLPFAFTVLFSASLLAQVAPQQIQVVRDPQALQTVQAALTALGGVAAIQQVQSWQALGNGQTTLPNACGQALAISRLYPQGMYLLSVLVTGLTAYAFGARQGIWLLAVLLGFFPVHMLVVSLARLLVPPNLSLSEDYSLNLSTRDERAHVISGRAQTGLLKKDKPS